MLSRPSARSTTASVLVLLLVVAAAGWAWWLDRRVAVEPGVRPSATKLSSATPRTGARRPTAERAAWTGRVVRVSDGDTIHVQPTSSSERVRVRLLGIDAPELAHHGQSAACGAVEAKRALSALAAGKEVRVVPDTVGAVVDRFGRRLGYVEVNGVDLALRQVSGGWVEAWAPASVAAPSRLGAYRQAEARARQGKVGSWRSCPRLGR